VHAELRGLRDQVWEKASRTLAAKSGSRGLWRLKTRTCHPQVRPRTCHCWRARPDDGQLHTRRSRSPLGCGHHLCWKLGRVALSCLRVRRLLLPQGHGLVDGEPSQDWSGLRRPQHGDPQLCRPAPELVHHLGRGSQYTSVEFRKSLKEAEILGSMEILSQMPSIMPWLRASAQPSNASSCTGTRDRARRAYGWQSSST
jgi:hypothetical protein